MPKTIHTRHYDAFKQVLRAAREDAGATQHQLAQKLGVTQSAVSKVEMGEQRIDLIQLREWCEALDIKLTDFVEHLERHLHEKSRGSKR